MLNNKGNLFMYAISFISQTSTFIDILSTHRKQLNIHHVSEKNCDSVIFLITP